MTIMNNMYHLTERDVKPELLSPEERMALQQEYDDRNNEYMDFIVNPRDKEWVLKRNAYLDKYAKETGFPCYENNTEGTGANDYLVGNSPKNLEICKRLEKLQSKMKSEEYTAHCRKTENFNRKDMEFLYQSHQQYLFDILKITCSRITQTDVLGNAIPSKEEYMKGFVNGSLSYKKENYIKGKDTIGIYPFCQRLRNAGYEVVYSHSGMICDHPWERCKKDAEDGSYKKGEHLYWGNTYPCTCILINGENHDEKEMKEMANSSGWNINVLFEQNRYIQKMMVFTLPLTIDGKTFTDIKEESQIKWAIYSDEMIKEKLETLTMKMVKAIKEKQDIGNTVNENRGLHR